MASLEPITEAIHVGVHVHTSGALCVAEVQRRGYEWTRQGKIAGGEYHYIVRHIERVEARAYPKIIERLEEVDVNLQERGDVPIFWLNVASIGQPFVALLQATSLNAHHVYLTNSSSTGRDKLGADFLAGRLTVLFQTDCLHLPRSAPEVESLAAQLLTFDRAPDVATAPPLAVALGLACLEPAGIFPLGFA